MKEEAKKKEALRQPYDVVIIGAGASGLMCAAHLPKRLRVLVIESNGAIGAKIKISGGGNCNVTNKYVTAQNYVGDSEFLKEVLQTFDNEALIAFLRRRGVSLTLRKGRYYFCKEGSESILRMFRRLTQKHTIKLGCLVSRVERRDASFRVITDCGAFEAKKLVVASGSASYPRIGGSDIGLRIAKTFAIAHTPFRAALVGLSVQKEQFWMRELSGVGIEEVRIDVGKKRIRGAMLFTHKGISGPAVLNCSLYWKKGTITIDFLPQHDVTKIVRRFSKKQISSVLPLPKRFVKLFLASIDLEDVPCGKLDDTQIKRLISLHRYTFAPAGNFGFSKAEVCVGGVRSDCLKASMETKKVKSLYFIGEIVDITGELGGYNFQWAFSSAVRCAKSITNESD